MNRAYVDLVREVLDHEVVDVDGLPCGMVDDIELTALPPGDATIAALLIGPGAWAPRLPALLALLVKMLFGRREMRVAWDEVGKIGERIELKQTAAALGLGVTDRKAGRWLMWLPGNEKAD